MAVTGWKSSDPLYHVYKGTMLGNQNIRVVIIEHQKDIVPNFEKSSSKNCSSYLRFNPFALSYTFMSLSYLTGYQRTNKRYNCMQ